MVSAATGLGCAQAQTTHRHSRLAYKGDDTDDCGSVRFSRDRGRGEGRKEGRKVVLRTGVPLSAAAAAEVHVILI